MISHATCTSLAMIYDFEINIVLKSNIICIVLILKGLTNLCPFDLTNVLNHCECVGHDLARVVMICQTVDNWYTRVVSQIKNVLQSRFDSLSF